MMGLLLFFKKYWTIMSIMGTITATIIGGTVKVTTYYIHKTEEIYSASKTSKELKTVVDSIYTELRDVKIQIKTNVHKTEKLESVVTNLAEKVLTKAEFGRYYRPMLNFDTEKKKMLYQSYCIQYPELLWLGSSVFEK